MRKTLRILVCDDDIIIRLAFKLIFEYMLGDPTIVLAEDGQIGIDHIKNSTFDLVLTDLDMPEADGLDVIRAAKAASKETLVILMTGNINNDDDREDPFRVEALQAGANYAFRKPLMPETLEAILRERGLL